MRNSQKTFILLSIIAILVLVIGSGVYKYVEHKQSVQKRIVEKTQNMNVTSVIATSTVASADIIAGWKIHVNKEIGFSFKYPQTWTVADGLKLNTCCLNVFNLENFDQSIDIRSRAGGMKAQFGYETYSPVLSKQEFIDNLIKISNEEKEIPMKPINRVSITSLKNKNGLDVIKFEGGVPGDVGYVISKEKDFSKVISVVVWNLDPSFDEVLSTFKFIVEDNRK